MVLRPSETRNDHASVRVNLVDNVPCSPWLRATSKARLPRLVDECRPRPTPRPIYFASPRLRVRPSFSYCPPGASPRRHFVVNLFEPPFRRRKRGPKPICEPLSKRIPRHLSYFLWSDHLGRAARMQESPAPRLTRKPLEVRGYGLELRDR